MAVKFPTPLTLSSSPSSSRLLTRTFFPSRHDIRCSRHSLPEATTSNSTHRTSPLDHSYDKRQTLFSPLTLPQSHNSFRSVTVRSQLTFPLISPKDQWGNWTALFAAGAFGLWYAPIFLLHCLCFENHRINWKVWDLFPLFLLFYAYSSSKLSIMFYLYYFVNIAGQRRPRLVVRWVVP